MDILGCFYLLAVMDSAAVNICVLVFVWLYDNLKPFPLFI